jgi:hypothetical protein
MGIGHAAVALAASRAVPRLNVGLLIFAALFADFWLGIFAAFGLEQSHVPPDFATRHYLTFTFPYWHGLVALLLWGILLGAMLCWFDARNRWRAFFITAALVLSHFVLDGLVHVPELPLLGQNLRKFGLGFGYHLPFELTLESLMAGIGIAVYWSLRSGPKRGRWGMTVFVLLLTALTWTQLWTVTPPTKAQLIPTWIIAPLVFSAVPYLFDRKRVAAQTG